MIRLLLFLIAAAALAGCSSFWNKSGPIRSVHVFGAPVALNFDQHPALDGFAITIYAGDGQSAKGVPINEGSLAIVMYDGLLKAPPATNPPPHQTWTYSPKDLKQSQVRTSLGIGYRFAPRWGANPPTRASITVLATYQGPEGKSIQSPPTSISVAAK